MAREIIILGVSKSPDGSVAVSGAFWLVAPAALVQPNPSLKSAVPSAAGGPTWGASTAELSALAAGTTVEQTFNSGQLSGLTTGQIQAGLQAAYSAAQTALNVTAPPSKWIGASWDGASWTAAP